MRLFTDRHGQSVTTAAPPEDVAEVPLSSLVVWRPREIYFDRNSVLNSAFEHLDIADEMIFSEEAEDKGPRVTTIRLAGKHHPMGVRKSEHERRPP
jgi:hypothetical protein